ncbi:MAG: hypothetical protein WAM66_12875 [Acidobacteriaceae bacterium]
MTGVPSEAPGREAIENASSLLHRLAADGAVVPLNLFGAAGGTVSDQPDFLATGETLPYVFSLIGGRNWKSGPGAKASPLMTEIWTLLNAGEARTAQEIQNTLGRELTEGAVLRGLVELWNGLRVIPVYDGAVTRWELTQAHFAAEMTASQKVAQTTALSALVSLYLESVVAASSEEIETFLSPLASRSRVREVVNGLSATRQLGLISVGAQPLMHVAGSLPEFAEPEPEAKPQAGDERNPPFAHRPRTAEGDAARKPFERRDRPQHLHERSGLNRGARRERKGPPRERRESARPGSVRPGSAPPGSAPPGSARPGSARPGSSGPGSRGENRFRPERRPAGGERKPYGKKPFEKSARPFGTRPLNRERPSGRGGEFPPRKFGKSGPKPWQDRSERPVGEGERPFRPRREEERGGERRPGKFGGAGKAGEKRFGGSGKSGSRQFGAAKKFGSRSGPGERPGSRPSRPRPSGSRSSDSRPSGPRSAGLERRSFSGGFKREKPGEKRPFFRERPAKAGDQGAPQESPRESSTGERRRPATRVRGWKPKSSGRGFAKSSGQGFGKSGKPGFKRGGKPAFKSGKPGFKNEGGSGFKKTGFGKSARPLGKSAKPFGKTGKPAPGRGKPGGFKPPFRKRRKEGGENAE